MATKEIDELWLELEKLKRELELHRMSHYATAHGSLDLQRPPERLEKLLELQK